MIWKKALDRFGRENGDWIAQGKVGHFLLWKDGRIWRGLYMVEFGNVVKFRFFAKNLKDAKQIAEKNYNWEV